MKSSAKFALVLLAVLSAADVRAGEVESPNEWTVLIFMNGKNDLEEFAIKDFLELAQVGSSKDVDFVVQMGRPEGRPDDQAPLKNVFGGWSGARRFHIQKGSTPAPGKELEVVGSGAEVDMGAPETLAGFLQWGKSRFPARRYAVIIWNHGQGYRLMMPDAEAFNGASVRRQQTAPSRGRDPRSHRAVSQDSDTGSIIYNADLRSSIASAFGPELRLVGFDACLMGMIETAYELREVAPVMVGSEELEPGDGWDYRRVAQFITGKPKSDEVAFAAGLVASYQGAFGDSDATTLSAVRPSDAMALAQQLSRLSDGLVADRVRLFPIVRKARARSDEYNAPDNPVTVDLIGFLDSLERELSAAAPNSPALADAKLANELARKMVLSNYASASRRGAFASNGIAIYFPASKGDFNRDSWSDGYRPTNSFKPIDFVKTQGWATFLQEYLGLPR